MSVYRIRRHGWSLSEGMQNGEQITTRSLFAAAPSLPVNCPPASSSSGVFDLTRSGCSSTFAAPAPSLRLVYLSAVDD